MIERLLLVIRHAWAMWRVLNLPKNRTKGTWRNLSAYDLLVLAEGEMKELRAAVWSYQHSSGMLHRVESEAADVSVYAAMVVDVCFNRRKS